jgi:bifunctional non-homologous end joining protein LigD
LKRFVEPCVPTSRPTFPKGPDWLHEIKFDGYRVQLDKEGKRAKMYSRRGADFTERYAPIAEALVKLPAREAIIDGELVVLREDGTADFHALHWRKFDPAMLCVWCFDLLSHAGKDLCEMPLTVRKLKLGTILRGYAHPMLRYSESFISGEKLFEMARKLNVEGIVSKRRTGTYHAARCDWVKVKTPEWKEANKDRGDLFGDERQSSEKGAKLP